MRYCMTLTLTVRIVGNNLKAKEESEKLQAIKGIADTQKG